MIDHTMMETGKSLIQQKRFLEAKQYFEQLATLHPNDPQPLKPLIQIAQRLKDFDLKIHYLKQILVLNPTLLQEQIMLAFLLAKRGESNALKEKIDTFLEQAEQQNTLTAQTARSLLLALQYASYGSHRTLQLLRFRALIERFINTHKNDISYRILLAELLLALGDYKAFIPAVTSLEENGKFPLKVQSLKRISTQLKAPEYPDFHAPKVFGIGLSRTATTSLNTALQALGFNAIHWQNPHTLDIINTDDFLLFDAFTDIPVSYQFEQLYYSYPNAQFIYTTRSMASWVQSVKTHYQNNRGIQKPHELSLPINTQRFRRAAGYAEMNLYGQYATWEEAFEAHDQRVRSFFKGKPSNKFLELRICEGEGWEKLCDFIGRSPPSTVEFPKQNLGPQKKDRQ
jgi:tetratricopeptide (TPR) repeat protein